ncbi:MAG: ROK family protein [Candidatus Nanoarchaeia archaeon]|nr:ROK family protein [Candidatus Nanoarchaeia archaeon]
MNLIGIDIGGTKITIGKVSNKKLKDITSIKINSGSSQEKIICKIRLLIDKLIDKETKAIGIGVPAIVDTKKGIVFETVNIPSWKKVNLKQILEDKYKIPVFVNNDSNCFALGEKYFGICKKNNNFVAVSISTGFGAGIIINNKLYEGNNCGAGEFGEIFFKGKSIEHYCSGKYFIKEYKTKGELLFEKAKQKDKNALKIFNEFGKNVGEALSVIVNSVDPEVIILGGSVSKSYKFFEKSMKKSLRQLIYERSYSRLKIKQSKTKNINVFGAAALYHNS